MRVNIDFIPAISDIIVGTDTKGNKIVKPAEFLEAINSALFRLNEILRLLGIAINTVEFGSISSTENVYCDMISVEFGVAGTELSAVHALVKVPTAIIGNKLDQPGMVYFSSTPTTGAVYLKSDTDNLSGTLVLI